MGDIGKKANGDRKRFDLESESGLLARSLPLLHAVTTFSRPFRLRAALLPLHATAARKSDQRLPKKL